MMAPSESHLGRGTDANTSAHDPMAEMPSPDAATEETIATYDATVAEFAERVFAIDLRDQLDRLATHLPPGGRILDAGCGPGRDVQHLKRMGFGLVGMDRSWGMLSEAARRACGTWVCGDLRALPFADGAFDGVWACASLLHLHKAEVPKALLELRRVLDGGIMFLAVKKGDGGGYATLASGHRRYFSYYQPAELHQLCRDASFSVLESSLQGDERRPGTSWLHILARAA